MIRLILLPVVTLFLGLALVPHSPDPESIPNTYPEHLTGAFTGGFGEETCRSCHFDYNLNPDGGKLSADALKSSVSPSEVIEITIEVFREKMGKAGFQLSARFADGRQAGTFQLENNERIVFTNSVSDSVQYIQHSAESTKPIEDNWNRWTVKWKAPETGSSPVIFNIAANAGNGDQSEFGDFIFAKEMKIELLE